MSYYDYTFEAQIEKLLIGNGAKTLQYFVVILPNALQDCLPFHEFPKLRIIGEIADHPIRGAWNPIADGRKYFILSQKFLKQAELQQGDYAEVRFTIDDQDYVEVPGEMVNALAINSELAEVWHKLSPGKKRFYCHQIASAKQQKTRQKRLNHVVEVLTG